MMMEALQRSMMRAAEQPRAYAEGGPVSAIPSLQQLADPNFDWSSMGQLNTSNPFTPMTQNVPMSVVQGPAYGSMGTDVYDWKAPTAQAAPLPYSILNSQVAQVYNHPVPTAVAQVDLPMPGVATPAPYVPEAPPPISFPDIYQPDPAAPVTPTPVTPSPVTPTPVTPTPVTPIVNPLGPDPFEERRQEAAQALADLKAREEQERIAREAEAQRLAEQKRIADKAAEAKRQADAAEAARRDYMVANPDVAKDYAKGQFGNMTPQEAAQFHYYRYGINEGRVAPSNILMDYMSANSDVAKDYAKGQFGDMTPQEAAQFHYYKYGINEGRAAPSVLKDYMVANPDVAKDYAKGQFGNMTPQEAAQFHYAKYGINEGRAPPGPAPAPAQQQAAPAPAADPAPAYEDTSWYQGDNTG
jgi:hypothetical protein